MTEDKDPEDILAQSKSQQRHTTEASSDTTDDTDLEAEIVAVYESLDADEVPSNLTMRYANLAALIRGLDAAGELDAVGADLREHLDRDSVDEESRGSVLSLAVRAGLLEVREDLLDIGKSAYESHLQNQDTEF